MIKIKGPNYSTYKAVEDRMTTFKNGLLDFIRPEDWASNGFISTGKKDSAIYVYCGVNIERWEKDDTPNIEDRKHSTHCPLISILSDEESTLGSTVNWF